MTRLVSILLEQNLSRLHVDGDESKAFRSGRGWAGDRDRNQDRREQPNKVRKM